MMQTDSQKTVQNLSGAASAVVSSQGSNSPVGDCIMQAPVFDETVRHLPQQSDAKLLLLLESEVVELRQQLVVTRELADFLQRCLDESSKGEP